MQLNIKRLINALSAINWWINYLYGSNNVQLIISHVYEDI
jgi:hypothetical protein